MDYFSFGGGKKGLVILPGASLKSIVLSADAVAAAYACFADEYTVYVFDCSSGWQEGCTVEGAAKNTAEAMKQLGIEKAHLFGCSLGGMIAQYVAINNPELVHKLVLGSTLSRHNEDSLKTCTEWCRLADAGDTVGLNRKMAEQVYSEEFRERFRDAFAAMETVGTI